MTTTIPLSSRHRRRQVPVVAPAAVAQTQPHPLLIRDTAARAAADVGAVCHRHHRIASLHRRHRHRQHPSQQVARVDAEFEADLAVALRLDVPVARH